MPKTVKVRVAVAVDKDGYWRAAGWAGAPKGKPEACAKECMDGGVYALYCLVADLPIPAEQTVEARVEGE